MERNRLTQVNHVKKGLLLDMAKLKIHYEGRAWEFQPDQTITIGRHPNCTIVISDPSVSRRHLTVQFDQQNWTVLNTGSTGSFENGKAFESLALDTSTTVYLGSPDGTPVRFEPEPPPPPVFAQANRNITLSYNGAVTTFVPGQVATVGRDTDCTFVIDEPTVSRRHLTVTYNGNEWVVQDTSSSGTYTAADRITSMPIREPVTLCLGSADGVHLGLWVDVDSKSGRNTGTSDEAVFSSVHTEFLALEENVQVQRLTSPPWWLLLPFGAWWRSKRIRSGLPLFLLVVWIAPIAIYTLYSNAENQQIITQPDAYAWSIYFGVLWAVLMWALIRPGMIPVWALVIVVAFETIVLAGTNIVQNLNQPLDPRRFTDALQVGLHEEVTKALAVIAVIIVYEFVLHAPRLSVRGYMYLGALSGVTFGVIESHTYLWNYYQTTANCLANANSSKDAVLCFIGTSQTDQGVLPSQILFRAITDGFTHALWASIAAFFIGLAVLHRRWAVQFVLVGLGIAIIFHALNDFLLEHQLNWLAVVLVGLAALMTVGYAVSGNQIDRIIGQIESSGSNSEHDRNRPQQIRR